MGYISELTDVRGSRLVSRNCIASSIDNNCAVVFVSPNLPDGQVSVYCEHRPPSVVKGDILDIYYAWTPSDAYYFALRPS